jgi:DNA-binding response OmpR family regulator
MPIATRILLVDDVAMFRDLGKVFLSRSGPVDLAASAEAAFCAAEKRAPSIVIADMHLPDEGGAELCRRFKTEKRWGNPGVVLLARPDAPADHAAAVRAGADDVLFKPLERDALVAAVRRLTDFTRPRGLPRARIETPIEITARGRSYEGVVRNVSRGGLFVNAPVRFDRSEEVALNFRLDSEPPDVSPTAQVVWTNPGEGLAQIGMRFLEIDARTVTRIEQYVSDHYPPAHSVPA